MTDLQQRIAQANAPKARKAAKSDKVWIGKSYTGQAAKDMLEAMKQAGINNGNRSEWIASLIVADLNKRLSQQSK